jgi:hypothetical protein
LFAAVQVPLLSFKPSGNAKKSVPTLSFRTNSAVWLCNPSDQEVRCQALSRVTFIRCLRVCTLLLEMTCAVLILKCLWNCQVVIPSSIVLVGFGKGKFRASNNNIIDDKELAFTLKSSADSVMINNTVATLETVVKEKRKTLHTAGVCYHELAEIAGASPDAFNLTLVRRAYLLHVEKIYT